MLTIVPRRWYSWDFSVREGATELAFMDRAWFRERATFSVDDRAFTIRRTSVRQGTFVLEDAGATLAEARKPSWLRRSFEVRVGSELYLLRSVSIFRREFRLWRDATLVGVIRPVSIVRRAATAELPAEMPREVQLFVVFLVLTLWKRAADAAAAG